MRAKARERLWADLGGDARGGEAQRTQPARVGDEPLAQRRIFSSWAELVDDIVRGVMGLHSCRSWPWVEVDKATLVAADDPILPSDTVQSIARAKESCEFRRSAKVTDDGFSLSVSIAHCGLRNVTSHRDRLTNSSLLSRLKPWSRSCAAAQPSDTLIFKRHRGQCKHSRSGDFHAAGLGAVESGHRKIRGRASLLGSRGGAGEVHPPREPVSRGQAGRHQFHRPMRRMAAGTSNARTMVASTTTAMPIPMPTAWTITERESPNPKNTAAMMAAAPVMSRPVRSSPAATARASRRQ